MLAVYVFYLLLLLYFMYCFRMFCWLYATFLLSLLCKSWLLLWWYPTMGCCTRDCLSLPKCNCLRCLLILMNIKDWYFLLWKKNTRLEVIVKTLIAPPSQLASNMTKHFSSQSVSYSQCHAIQAPKLRSFSIYTSLDWWNSLET